MNSDSADRRAHHDENPEREAAIAEVAEFLRCSDFSTEQVMAIHTFACALITGGVSPGFFSLISDALEDREVSR